VTPNNTSNYCAIGLWDGTIRLSAYRAKGLTIGRSEWAIISWDYLIGLTG